MAWTADVAGMERGIVNRSKASEHYQNLLDWHGTREERQRKPRAIGFTRPKSVEARGPMPTGVETQTWEGWHEDGD